MDERLSAEDLDRADDLGAEAKLDRIRAVLSGQPVCDLHDDGDAVACGWKHDVQAIREILGEDA